MHNDVPSEVDWGDVESDRDVKYAFQIFFGKTNNEMISEFKKNVTMRTSDLKFMSKIPFKYYMRGFLDFIQQELYEEFDKPDVMNCFVTLVEEKLMNSPDEIMPLIDVIDPTLVSICMNQDRYGLDEEIYGDFKVKYKNISSMRKSYRNDT